MIAAPDRSEADPYYFTYIDQVPSGDVRQMLRAQLQDVTALLQGIPEGKSLHRYAPGKWSIREVVSHINDAERVFAFRGFWFARGFAEALPSFDQDIAVGASGADARSLASHIDEFRAVRASTLAFVDSIEGDVWDRRGVASGKSFTVRALAFITAGHAAHHLKILRERYL